MELTQTFASASSRECWSEEQEEEEKEEEGTCILWAKDLVYGGKEDEERGEKELYADWKVVDS
ncbi:hypothetical protein N7513_012605 [Penicillium frequentans]|nr:hypothetical protein N7513_012605 [Penicillium glabrum]